MFPLPRLIFYFMFDPRFNNNHCNPTLHDHDLVILWRFILRTLFWCSSVVQSFTTAYVFVSCVGANGAKLGMVHLSISLVGIINYTA